METIRTKYLGNLRTEMAASYGCCALTIMGIAAQTHGFNIDGTEVKTQKKLQ